MDTSISTVDSLDELFHSYHQNIQESSIEKTEVNDGDSSHLDQPRTDGSSHHASEGFSHLHRDEECDISHSIDDDVDALQNDSSLLSSCTSVRSSEAVEGMFSRIDLTDDSQKEVATAEVMDQSDDSLRYDSLQHVLIQYFLL